MRYAIYFTLNDGTKDSINVEGTRERDANIRDMLSRNEFQYISYCKIYASGEYGKRTVVKETTFADLKTDSERLEWLKNNIHCSTCPIGLQTDSEASCMSEEDCMENKKTLLEFIKDELKLIR